MARRSLWDTMGSLALAADAVIDDTPGMTSMGISGCAACIFSMTYMKEPYSNGSPWVRKATDAGERTVLRDQERFSRSFELIKGERDGPQAPFGEVLAGRVQHVAGRGVDRVGKENAGKLDHGMPGALREHVNRVYPLVPMYDEQYPSSSRKYADRMEVLLTLGGLEP